MPEEQITSQEQPKMKKKKFKTFYIILIVIGVIILGLAGFYVYKVGLIQKLRVSMGEIGDVQLTISENWDGPGGQEYKIGEKGIFYVYNPVSVRSLDKLLYQQNIIYHIKKEDFDKIVTYLEQSDIIGTDLEDCKNNPKDFGDYHESTNFGFVSGCNIIKINYYKCRILDRCYYVGESDYYDVKTKDPRSEYSIKEVSDFLYNFNNILKKYEISLVGDYPF